MTEMEKEVLLEGKKVVHRRKQSREREENKVSIVLLVPVQTSNFTCAEPNTYLDRPKLLLFDC